METTKKEEFTRVQRTSDNKYNLITEDGKLLSKQWFEWIDDFKDGFAKVQRTNGDWAKIDKNGKIVSK